MYCSATLLIHGAIIELIGLICGFPFWIAIIRKRKNSIIRSWRVAHTTLVASGLLILVIGVIPLKILLKSNLLIPLELSLIISGYSFSLALILGAITGKRALTPSFGILNIALFTAHMIGAAGSIAGICTLIYGLL